MERCTASSGNVTSVCSLLHYFKPINATELNIFFLQGLTKEGEKTSYILSDCLKDEEPHRSVQDLNVILIIVLHLLWLTFLYLSFNEASPYMWKQPVMAFLALVKDP